eukprot:CAMPEP_0113637056 /NCGR_PEP_ID=MMETSP0017_2-20120614/19376_1 /TAXON_ID=2856 /ORGANISM="Cylindrotheca closterium" /LENGTH=320 /DNA_ID=CAMNT_0000548025 /DNA_START=82 /DNA_END=1040 /DNA_ORIENTATION=- /assembly_acc=CAM_ASM_000147
MTPLLRLFSLVSLYLTLAYASDEPPVIPTNTPSVSINSTAPSAAPSFTTAPSETPDDACANTAEFSVTEWNKFQGEWHLQTLGCDDILVDCYEFGNLGQVKDHCCKCREACGVDQCNEAVFTRPLQRNDASMDGYSGFLSLFIPIACLVGLCVLLGLYLLRKKERRIIQETMEARRLEQERRENNGLTVEENTNRRFEQFVTRFHFQTVLPDKSNISAEAIRKSITTENKKKDEETPTEKSTSFEEGDHSPAADVAKELPARNIISEQLASWKKPKDECCICLECYTKGETICAPATTRCNHVFHESCIKEWLLAQDQCP